MDGRCRLLRQADQVRSSRRASRARPAGVNKDCLIRPCQARTRSGRCSRPMARSASHRMPTARWSTSSSVYPCRVQCSASSRRSLRRSRFCCARGRWTSPSYSCRVRVPTTQRSARASGPCGPGTSYCGCTWMPQRTSSNLSKVSHGDSERGSARANASRKRTRPRRRDIVLSSSGNLLQIDVVGEHRSVQEHDHVDQAKVLCTREQDLDRGRNSNAVDDIERCRPSQADAADPRADRSRVGLAQTCEDR